MARVEKRTTVLVCGDLKGAWPLSEEGESARGLSEENAAELKNLFSKRRFAAACKDCRKADGWRACNVCWNQSGRPPLSADFYGDEVPNLGVSGDVPASAVFVNVPWIEHDPSTGTDVILFRWWSATFSLDLPEEVVRSWGEENKSGNLEFTQEAYERWKEENDVWGLQDGVRYFLGDVPYELDGFGDNGCSPDEESVNAALARMGRSTQGKPAKKKTTRKKTTKKKATRKEATKKKASKKKVAKKKSTKKKATKKKSTRKKATKKKATKRKVAKKKATKKKTTKKKSRRKKR